MQPSHIPPEIAALGGAAFSGLVLYLVVAPIVKRCFDALAEMQRVMEGQVGQALNSMNENLRELSQVLQELKTELRR